MNWDSLREWGRQAVETGAQFAASGTVHRRRLSDIGIRISVSGVRGKSTAVRWLYDILSDREYDTYAKVTGVNPISIYDGVEHEIERPAKVRLYENERQLRKFGPVDAAVLENQGIREYTTRLVNEQYVRPHVIFLTNIREDHLDTMGADRLEITRSLARAVPSGTHVVCGEQDETITAYLEAELDRRDATMTQVHVPAEHEGVPGAELVHGLNPVLQTVGEPPLDDEDLESYLARMRVSWTELPDGRVFNAAAANDTQSTEFIRRRLLDGSDEVIQPLLYLRDDRRGRTASFYRYLEGLADRGAIEQARVVGRDADLFQRRASFPVVTHDDSEPPADVLDDALADDWPVVLMVNAVSEFMEEMIDVIDERTAEANRSATSGDPADAETAETDSAAAPDD